ncbi:MAG: hypothetical protein IKC63_03150 [Clostridia bacterium]|nr:hypothetical protein [Clostridia bacterium]
MKRKLLIVLVILFVISVLIGTSPIIDYFYSLADGVTSSAPVSSAPDSSEGGMDTVNEKTVVFAVVLSALTVAVSFVVYLKKRKV